MRVTSEAQRLGDIVARVFDRISHHIMIGWDLDKSGDREAAVKWLLRAERLLNWLALYCMDRGAQAVLDHHRHAVQQQLHDLYRAKMS